MCVKNRRRQQTLSDFVGTKQQPTPDAALVNHLWQIISRPPTRPNIGTHAESCHSRNAGPLSTEQNKALRASLSHAWIQLHRGQAPLACPKEKQVHTPPAIPPHPGAACMRSSMKGVAATGPPVCPLVGLQMQSGNAAPSPPDTLPSPCAQPRRLLSDP